MSSLNRVELIGYLGADPEVVGRSGDGPTAMRVATSERWKDRETGEQQERTEWHSVKVWGPSADYVQKYARKGHRVFVAGRLQTSKWTDQGGVERWRTEVVVSFPTGQVILLEKRERGEGEAPRETEGGREREPRSAGRVDERQSTRAQDLDDEIPF